MKNISNYIVENNELISGFNISPYDDGENPWNECLCPNATNAFLMTINDRSCYDMMKELVSNNSLATPKQFYKNFKFKKLTQKGWKLYYNTVANDTNPEFKQYAEYMAVYLAEIFKKEDN